MEKNQENILNDFLQNGDKSNQEQPKKEVKKIVNEKEGLIERVDKTFIVEDGRQLLREQY